MVICGTKVAAAVSIRENPEAFNRALPAYSRGNVESVNRMKEDMAPRRNEFRPEPVRSDPYRQAPVGRPEPVQPGPYGQAPQPVKHVPQLKMPELMHPILRGQKTSLNLPDGNVRLRICFGWNVKDERCDIDASAFLVGPDGRVPDDDWFVFYGQPESPDRSVRFDEDGRTDRECITVDLARLDRRVQKLVFVMTINEAIEQRLHFGMISEAWLRVLDDRTGRELLSYRPEELFSAVTSMTLGELYLHNGLWKFNPVGNGVKQDLAGQCAIYGVHIC